MIIDLNPIKEPEPLTIQLEEYVVKVPHKDFYEANKLVTADFDDDNEGYMLQVKIAYEAVINQVSSFQKMGEDGKLEDCPKPNVDLKLNEWQAEMLWTVVANFVDDLFKKKLNQE